MLYKYLQKKKERDHLYYLKNKDKFKEYGKKWREKNPERYRAMCEKYRKKNPEQYRKHHREYQKEWRKKNQDKMKEWYRQYNKTEKRKKFLIEYKEKNIRRIREWHRKSNQKKRKTPKGILDHRMEVSILQSMKENKLGRKWEELVCYSIENLIEHFEKRYFKKLNLTWEKFFQENYQIDHIKPKSLFKYETAEDPEFKKCWALENLQPMEKIANIKKGNKFNSPLVGYYSK